MSAYNDRAFPRPHMGQEGMTKKEYFAAKALQAILSNPEIRVHQFFDNKLACKKVAETCQMLAHYLAGGDDK